MTAIIASLNKPTGWRIDNFFTNHRHITTESHTGHLTYVPIAEHWKVDLSRPVHRFWDPEYFPAFYFDDLDRAKYVFRKIVKIELAKWWGSESAYRCSNIDRRISASVIENTEDRFSHYYDALSGKKFTQVRSFVISPSIGEMTCFKEERKRSKDIMTNILR